jgi:hypothetical protein
LPKKIWIFIAKPASLVIQQEKIGDIQQVTGYFAILYEWNKKLSGCNDWNYGLCHFQNILLGSIVLPKWQNYGYSYKTVTIPIKWPHPEA